MNPDLWIIHAFVGWVHENEGRPESALAEFQKAFDLSGGGNTEPVVFRAHVQALMGERAAAKHIIGMLTELMARNDSRRPE